MGIRYTKTPRIGYDYETVRNAIRLRHEYYHLSPDTQVVYSLCVDNKEYENTDFFNPNGNTIKEIQL